MPLLLLPSPLPRRLKLTTPQPLTPGFSERLRPNVILAVFTIRHRPTVCHHLLIDVERSNVADSYEAFVSVPFVALTGYFLALNEPLKGLLSQLTAHLLLALTGAASLLHLRGVDAVEPDLGFVYVDGVAVDDAGFASDVGVGGGWESEEDYGECEGDA